MRFRIHPELTAFDINRAASWYEEKLGLRPSKHGGESITTDMRPGDFDSELLYETPTARFGIYESSHAGNNHATAARLVVEDFDEAFAELLERGVVFEDYDFGEDFYTVDGILTSPDGEKTCWFKDSEGNILAMGSSD
jgi:catechol 2,3-dioxygenase-like lactoylglutathione lyase family enzyme